MTEDNNKGAYRKPAAVDRDSEEMRLDEQLSLVKITPESKESYEARVGYSVKVIDTKEIHLGVHFARQFKKGKWGPYTLADGLKLKRLLVESGVEAIVDSNYSRSGARNNSDDDNIWFDDYYGLPVAKVVSE